MTPDQIKKNIALLKRYDRAYDAGKPVVTDAQYDKVYDATKRAAPSNAYFHAVGAPIKRGRQKTKPPITIGSLNKIRPGDVDRWVADIERTEPQRFWSLLPKLDGASVLLSYDTGKLTKAFKRGKGDESESVLDHAKHIQGARSFIRKSSIYSTAGSVLVRGEVVMHRSIFAQYANRGQDVKSYSTPRNLVAGILNRLDVSDSVEDLRNCTFIALQVFFMDKRSKTWRRPDDAHKEQLFLAMMGFTLATNPARYAKGHAHILKLVRNGHDSLKRYLPVVPLDGGVGDLSVVEGKPTRDLLVERLREMKNALDVDIDGLVLQPMANVKWQRRGSHLESRPSFMTAVKLDANEQDHLDVKIGSIDWDISKRGLLKPRIVLSKPANFGGVEVTYATANNAANVVKWGLRAGRPIRMIRSGDVIPRVVAVFDNKKWHYMQKRAVVKGVERVVTMSGIVDRKIEATLPTKCPACGTRLVRTKAPGAKSWTDLACPNTKCPGRHSKQVTTFFKTLGVEGVAAGVVGHLIDAGLTTVPKILRGATIKNLRRLEGYGDKQAVAVASAIAGALKNKSLARIMHASGVFQSQTFALGETRLTDIVGHVGAGAVMRENPAAIRRKLASLHGIGRAGIDLFVAKLPEWRKFYVSVADFHEESRGPQTLRGMRVAFTGFRDAKAEQWVTSHGGSVGGVSKQTNVLFAASLGSTKCGKADSYGVPVVAQSKMWDWLKQRSGN